MTDFENTPISIKLRGAEWFAVLAFLATRELSPEGQIILAGAARHIADRLAKAA